MSAALSFFLSLQVIVRSDNDFTSSSLTSYTHHSRGPLNAFTSHKIAETVSALIEKNEHACERSGKVYLINRSYRKFESVI